MEAKVRNATILNPSDVGVSVVEDAPSWIDDVPKEQTDQDHTATGNPHAPDDGLSVSKKEYWDKWYAHPYADREVSYEWHNGRLEAKALSTLAQLSLYRWFVLLLEHYVQSHPVAELLYLETGFNVSTLDLEESDGKRGEVRKPDIGVILKDNPVEWKEGERVYKGICDMCVESLSDSTKAAIERDTVVKKQSYAGSGVREYYILDPSEQYMHCYRLNADREYEEIEPDKDGVIRSAVLPGFQFRWDDLILQPAIREMLKDKVYSGYIVPEYQEEVEARRRAEERAADEAAARQQAEEQAAKAEEQAAIEVAARQEEAAARRAAEEEMRALQAELARLRQRRS